MNKHLNLMIRLAIGVGILFFLLYTVGIKKVAETSIRVGVVYFLASLFLTIAGVVFGAVNIKVLLDPIRRVKFPRLLSYYFFSWSIGLLVPGKIGDFSIIYFLEKEGIPPGESAAVALMDKIITIICIFAFSVVGFFSFFQKEQAIKLTIFLVAIFSAGLFGILSGRVRELIKKYLLRSYAERFKGFSRIMFDYISNKKQLLIANFILTVAKFFLSVLAAHILLLHLQENLPFMTTAFVMAAGTIISLIPLSISGLGIRESASVYLLGLAGVKNEVSTSIMILLLAQCYIIAAAVFIVNRFENPFSKRVK